MDNEIRYEEWKFNELREIEVQKTNEWELTEWQIKKCYIGWY